MTEVACKQSPLWPLRLFIENGTEQLSLVQSLKRPEASLGAGETLIFESQAEAPLYKLLDGWAFRFKTLREGRRQILNFLLPGDYIGVQQKMGDAATHRVMTQTDAVFCVFERDSLWELHRKSPSMVLSLVHTNKTMRKLEQIGLHRIVDGRLHLDDAKALAQLADLYGDGSPPKRPLV